MPDQVGAPRAAGDFGQDPGFREADARQRARLGGGYEWQPSADPAFFPGRQAEVLFKGQVRGTGPCSSELRAVGRRAVAIVSIATLASLAAAYAAPGRWSMPGKGIGMRLAWTWVLSA